MPDDFDRDLTAARAGSPDALGRVLDACRAYLQLVAERELAPDLRAKGGASDLVQETLMDAVHDFGRFQGGTEGELLAWLRRMLLNNLVSFTRLYRETGKRQVGREVALAAGSSVGVDPSAGSLSPSGHAVAAEEGDAIRAAMARLPDDYRRVLALRYEDGQTFEQIGTALGLTANAARKLWSRAIKRLQDETGETPCPTTGETTD